MDHDLKQAIKAFSFFHLNLAYSSIEEEQRPEVIEKCYWPLLNLIEDLQIPAGIEVSAYTLESAAGIDNKWISKLKELINSGLIEFVGSGYAQIIGPLVPARVNEANLQWGNRIYEQLLGVKPKTALVNEQVYSSGLVELYLNAGYEALIMEWNNPAHCHPEWQSELQYYPQYARGNNECKIPLIWNNSLAFQKFQRYAHGDMELEEYLDYLGKYRDREDGMFALYGNDVEIFDFRPGRYHTEAVLSQESEWQRIRCLYRRIKQDEKIQLLKPAEVLSLLDNARAGHILSLESAQEPIPVKKQAKYNVTRWAVTGRDDLGINTDCWCIYENLLTADCRNDEDWRELCYLWSSDFRTHITEKRWQAYRLRLLEMKARTSGGDADHESKIKKMPIKGNDKVPALFSINQARRYLNVAGARIKARLDCRRGLTVHGLWRKDLGGPFLFGTLPHGFYNDIAMDFDWYTGHSIIECLGKPKITDLNPLTPKIEIVENTEEIMVSGKIPTAEGEIKKAVLISAQKAEIGLEYEVNLGKLPAGSFRLGHITLNPLAFSRDSLFYRTCNGGHQAETFLLGKKEFDQGSPVSFLVSANNCVGMTEGWLEIGDNKQLIRVEVDKCSAALVGMINYRKTNDSYFLRLSFSAGEWDETRRLSDLTLDNFVVKIRVKIIAKDAI